MNTNSNTLMLNLNLLLFFNLVCNGTVWVTFVRQYIQPLEPSTVLLRKFTDQAMHNKNNISPVTPFDSYTGESWKIR